MRISLSEDKINSTQHSFNALPGWPLPCPPTIGSFMVRMTFLYDCFQVFLIPNCEIQCFSGFPYQLPVWFALIAIAIISLCRWMVTGGCDSVYNNGDMSLPLNIHTFIDPPRNYSFLHRIEQRRRSYLLSNILERTVSRPRFVGIWKEEYLPLCDLISKIRETYQYVNIGENRERRTVWNILHPRTSRGASRGNLMGTSRWT